MNLLTDTLENVIIQMCAKRFDISVDDYLNKKSNKPENVLKRHYSYYLIRKNTLLSFRAIGELFGTDHSVVNKGYNRIEAFLSYDKRIINEINNLQKIIDNFKAEKENHFLNQWLTQ